jgi:putative transposase
MLAAALEAEVDQYIAELATERDERGHRLVVRNGHHRPRTVVTAAGPVEVTAPRVNDRRVDEATGERKRFSSRILAPWCRKSPKISEVLPLLYLHGLSSGDFVLALEQFLGGSAGLSAAPVTRLTKQWQDDHTVFQQRNLDEVAVLETCYATAADAACATPSWWSATARWACGRPWPQCSLVFPAARHQRCWVHKARNITNALPKSAHPGATKAMQEIYNAEDRAHAEKAIDAFVKTYGTKWPKAAAKITDDNHRRPGRAARLLRLPGRVLGPLADHEPDRVHILHGQAADQGHPRGRQPGRRPRDGVQAGRVRPGTLARDHRRLPRRPGPLRSHVRERLPGRARRDRRSLITRHPNHTD